METTIAKNKYINWSALKKHTILVLATSFITASLMLVPFYFNTNNATKNHSDSIKELNGNVTEIKKNYQEIIINEKLDKQQLGDVQRQVGEIKLSLTKLDEKVEQKFDNVNAKFDKIYDVLTNKK